MASVKTNKEVFKIGLSGYLKNVHPEYNDYVIDRIIRHLIL